MGSERPVLNPHGFEQWCPLLSTGNGVRHRTAVSLEESSATAFVGLGPPRPAQSPLCLALPSAEEENTTDISKYCIGDAERFSFLSF